MIDDTPITLSGFPRAIVHIDGDAFFTSVEQSLHPEYKGRPVVTGKERNIIACASYEAKAIGIKRGVALWEAKRKCPNLVILPSDYEAYSLYSKRMFDIMRKYTPLVEEYSIDEGFADISGMRRVFRMSYDQIARNMQQEICEKLDIGVSVGLSISKTLAKLASDFRKPRGFTPVRGMHIHRFLKEIPLEDVWGFGPNTCQLLRKYGLQNAADFVNRPEKWAERMLNKPGRDIWNELRGTPVHAVETEEKSSYASISKSKTFITPSSDKEFVKAKLIRNMESAFIKLRRHGLKTREIHVILRRRDFVQHGLKARLNRGTFSTQEAMPSVSAMFDEIYREGTSYRCTSVVLALVEQDTVRQYELFEDPVKIEKLCNISKATDEINHHYGKHTLAVATSLFLQNQSASERGTPTWRKLNLLPGETERRRINLPRIDIKV